MDRAVDIPPGIHYAKPENKSDRWFREYGIREKETKFFIFFKIILLIMFLMILVGIYIYICCYKVELYKICDTDADLIKELTEILNSTDY